MKLFGPPARAVILVVLSACKFDPSSGGTDAPAGDAGNVDAEPDALIPPDAAVCFGNGLVGQVCLPSPPTGALALEGVVDTSACGTGTVLTITGVETCVLSGATITIGDQETLQGIGTRPLMLVAAEAITVEGILNVGSRLGQPPGAAASAAAASAATCPAPAANDVAEDDEGGAGGGAGASFVGTGGDGGRGDQNNNGGKPGPGDGAVHVAAVPKPVVLRAGCRGTNGGNGENGVGAGTGGLGGGVLYLLAGSRIEISGVVTAHGAGGGAAGQQGGGGGGGSGGMIGLEAPTLTVSGAVTANGGGGGEGGSNAASGDRGDDGAADGGRASGGTGTFEGGNGGLSSGRTGAAETTNGDGGSSDIGGGGGGGGGAGYIYVKGELTGGTFSPPADDQ